MGREVLGLATLAFATHLLLCCKIEVAMGPWDAFLSLLLITSAGLTKGPLLLINPWFLKSQTLAKLLEVLRPHIDEVHSSLID